jgi:hypothetical protein
VMRLGHMDKEPGERRIDAITDQAAHAGGIVLFPLGVERKRDIGGPTRQGAGGGVNVG